MLFGHRKTEMITSERALPGRDSYAFEIPAAHFVSGRPIQPPFPDSMATAILALGCFWGAERLFWQTDGVWTTAVGYSGGFTPYPTYEEVCTGLTGHAEAVLAVYDPTVVSYQRLLSVFFEGHDPTQGMRQGNDIGTQYRSAIYYADAAQQDAALSAAKAYQEKLTAAGYGSITTEIAPTGRFYYAEGYHQQYLAKNPDGYCGLGGTGVSCPVGLFATEADER